MKSTILFLCLARTSMAAADPCTEADGCAGCTHDGDGYCVKGTSDCEWCEDCKECFRKDGATHCDPPFVRGSIPRVDSPDCIASPPSPPPAAPPPLAPPDQTGTFVGIGAGAVVVVLLAMLGVVYMKKKKKKSVPDNPAARV